MVGWTHIIGPAFMASLRAVTHYIRISENMIRCSRKTISTDRIVTDSDLIRIGRIA
jgi:hypothetical protein